MSEFPRLTITLDQMRLTMKQALMGQMEELNRMVQHAVDTFCTKDNLEAIVLKQVRETLPFLISSEIESHFRYGKGNESIRVIVRKAIEEAAKAASDTVQT